jgi:hypothetical protein
MDNDRRRRDAAGVGPYPKERDRLVAMSSLDNWHVSKGEPDIRGWEVRTVSGRQLGVVRDLLIDREAGEAVMLDVDLPGSLRNALVPIRVAQIDRAARVILMDSADLGVVDETAPVVDVADARQDVAIRRDVEVRREVMPPATEIVVDRRPIVEETVVRRRDADGMALADAPLDDEALRARDAERRREDRRRIDRMGTDL